MTKGKEKENAQIKRKKQGKRGKIQKGVKRCKRKGKVLSMEIRNKKGRGRGEEKGTHYTCILSHYDILVAA